MPHELRSSEVVQEEILHDLVCNTHILYTPDILTRVNYAFAVNIQPRTYHDSRQHPKGLTLDGDKKSVKGISAYDLALILCGKLNVRYEDKMGRGFQVRACVEALRGAGYGINKGVQS